MIHCLKALNPFSFCITPLDYEDRLIEIGAILKGLDTLSSSPSTTDLSTNKQIEWLEKAYALAIDNLRGSARVHPDKPLSLLIAEIFRKYAELSFNTNPFTAKQLLLCSYNLHLSTIGLASPSLHLRDFDTLQTLKSTLEAYPKFFTAFENECSKISADRCAALTHADAFALPNRTERLIQLGQTVALLESCYRSIDDTTSTLNENTYRSEQLFNLAESLYLLADNGQAKKLLAQHYIELSSHLIQSEKFNQIEDLLLKAVACDPSGETLSRVDLCRYLTESATGTPSQSIKHLQNAFAHARNLDESPTKNALLAELNYHFSGYLLLPDSLDLVEAEKSATMMQDYAEAARLEGDDNQLFALYDLRMGELKMILNDFSGANSAVQRALQTLSLSPKTHFSTLLKAQALQQLISTH